MCERVEHLVRPLVDGLSLHRVGELPPTEGVQTGLHQLDTLLGGIRPGELVVVGARPALGKTSLACQMAIRAGLPEKARQYLTDWLVLHPDDHGVRQRLNELDAELRGDAPLGQ